MVSQDGVEWIETAFGPLNTFYYSSGALVGGGGVVTNPNFIPPPPSVFFRVLSCKLPFWRLYHCGYWRRIPCQVCKIIYKTEHLSFNLTPQRWCALFQWQHWRALPSFITVFCGDLFWGVLITIIAHRHPSPTLELICLLFVPWISIFLQTPQVLIVDVPETRPGSKTVCFRVGSQVESCRFVDGVGGGVLINNML